MNSEKLLALCREKRRRGEKNIANNHLYNMVIVWFLWLAGFRYNAISSKTNVPGGQGHKFYEEWRKLPRKSQEAKSIASQSKAYYDSIRETSYAN